MGSACSAAQPPGLGFATAIDVDAGGNPYILGYFADQIKLGATILRLSEPSSLHIFLAKLSSQGQFQWARMAGSVPPNSTHVSNGNDLAAQPDGTVSITGIYSYSMSFENIALGTDKAINQIFVVRYDTQGNLTWAGRAGGGSRAVPSFSGKSNVGFGVGTGPEGVTYVTGQYGGQGVFGPFALDSTANGLPNMYVAKIGAGATLGVPPENSRELAVFPNPAAAGTTVAVHLAQQTQAATELRLLNAVGQVVQQQTLAAGSSQCDISTQKLRPSLYRVQLLGSKGFSRALLVL